MKSRKMRIVTTVIALLLLTLAVGACSSSSNDDSAQTDSGDSEASGDSSGDGEAITLNFFTLDDPDQLLAIDQMVAAWKATDAKWSNVTVNIRSVPFAQLFPTIEASVAGGADFDAFLADGPDIKHYAFNNVIIPLQEYYTDEEMKGWVPQSVTEGSYNGTFYAPPIMQSCSMMFYNKDFTEEAGLQPPVVVQGWTIEEATDAWQTTTTDSSGDGTPDIWGLRWGQGTWWGDYEQGIPRRSAGQRGTPTFQGVGEDGITFKGYLDTPEAIGAYETFRSWHQGENAVSPAESIPDIFVSKQAAFYISPDNAIGTINRLYPDGDFNYGVTGIPYFADGAQLCHTGSWHFGVSPNSANQEAAISMVKFFAGSEGSRIWYDAVQQLPARYDLLNELPEYTEEPKMLFQQGLLEIGEPRIQTPCYTEYQQIHAELLQNLAQGSDVDVEQLVTTAAGNMEQACSKYQGWNE